MQLTGYENANNMRNVKCAGTQTSMEWPYCSFLYCVETLIILHITKTESNNFFIIDFKPKIINMARKTIKK